MPPCIVLNPGAEVLVRDFRSGSDLAGNQVVAAIHASHESHRLDDRVEVIAALVAAFAEVVKIDDRRIEWITAFEPDLTRGVVRVGLDDGPREKVLSRLDQTGVIGEVAVKVAR